MSGLYIHIPFCVSKCSYCDFISFTNCSSLHAPYIEALSLEFKLYKKDIKPDTLYIGGGTPSVLPIALMEKLCANFSGNYQEASFECNPESLTEDKVKLLKDYSFTRLSLGMQTTSEKHLKLIGRAHSRAQFFKAYEIASKYFDNLSIDIIAALPEQTLQDFKNTLKETVSLNPKHISVYGIEVEEGTKLYASGYQPDEDLYRAMLEHTCSFLTCAGFNQYEISNYSRPGFESRHNINYWDNGEYLGLGVAAASYIKGERRSNTENIQEYLKAISDGVKPIAFSETLTGKEKEGERIILGLRKLSGVKETPEMLKLFGKDFAELSARGLIIEDSKIIRLSEDGKYFASEVFRHFVAPF